ncbi:MAG: hypothetical protein V2B20_25430 [Pseudomonadota bacterium]
MMTRREILLQGIFALWMATSINLFSCVGLKSVSPERQELRIRWHVPRDQMPLIREKLYFKGEVEPDLDSATATKGLPITFLIVGAVFLPYLVDAIIAAYRDIRYGGIVITFKDNGEVFIINDCRIPGGTILIKRKDDVEFCRIEKEPPPQMMFNILKPVKR